MRVRRFVVAGAVLSLLAAPAVRAAQLTPGASPYPGGRWEPPPVSFGASEDSNLDVRMDDGAVLKVDVVYPTDPVSGARAAGPFPVLLNQDLYAGTTALGVVGAAQAAATSDKPVPGEYFVQRGYIFVHAHDRGTGGSDGPTDFASGPRMGLDGVELAYWASDPTNVPGSNGKVGLQGCSALGNIQLATLAKLGELQRQQGTVYVPGTTIDAPAHSVPATVRTNPIKASVPMCILPNPYEELQTDNGVATISAAALLAGPAVDAAFFGLNTQNPSSDLQDTTAALDMLTNGDAGYYRQHWSERDFVRHADDIGRTGVPLLSSVGFQEAGFMGAQPLYAALQNVATGRPAAAAMLPNQKTSPKYQTIVGDWTHGAYLDLGIELEWFETWMRGVDTGVQSAHGAIHLTERNAAATWRWISEPTYPMTTAYQAMYLDHGAAPTDAGTLSTTKPSSSGAEQLVWGQAPQLTYSVTKPFDVDTTLLGPAAVSLWVQSSTSNVQLFVELQDVAPDGSTVTPITHGSILGSRSHLDPGRSWTTAAGLPIRPYLTSDADRYLVSNTPVKLDVPLQPVTWRLPAGHTLRLMIASHPGSECAPNPKAAINAVPFGCVVSVPVAQSLAGGVFQILRGADHPSLLDAALVPSDQIPTIEGKTTPTSGGVALPQW